MTSERHPFHGRRITHTQRRISYLQGLPSKKAERMAFGIFSMRASLPILLVFLLDSKPPYAEAKAIHPYLAGIDSIRTFFHAGTEVHSCPPRAKHEARSLLISPAKRYRKLRFSSRKNKKNAHLHFQRMRIFIKNHSFLQIILCIF